MTEYLTGEQRAELERQLAEGAYLTEAQEQEALQQGVRMAQMDMKNGVSGAKAGMRKGMQGHWREEDGGMEQGVEMQAMLQEYGFENVRELAEAYERTQAAVSELRGMLKKLLDMEKAERTAAELDVMHPEYAVRRRIEMELRPMREEMRTAALARLIQRDWQDSAAEMYDLERLMPEIAEYIMRNPKYAGESDGLRRAYDAVRSQRYRSEEEMMRDPAFVERMAGSEAVKEAVLRAHMEEIRRSAAVPQVIGAGQEAGKMPLTGKKPITGMEMAKKRLEGMLGVGR